MRAMSLLLLGAFAAGTAQAATVDERLADYQRQGARSFSAKSGEALWTKEFPHAATGKARSCATCHGRSLREPGQHAETGKVIEAMKPAANAKRLTDAKHIEKWFLRNCKWTYGRECTPQEKGDFLLFIRD